jgi:hypothetical protein
MCCLLDLLHVLPKFAGQELTIVLLGLFRYTGVVDGGLEPPFPVSCFSHCGTLISLGVRLLPVFSGHHKTAGTDSGSKHIKHEQARVTHD